MAVRQCETTRVIRSLLALAALTTALLAVSGCRLFLTPSDDEPGVAEVIRAVDAEGGAVALHRGTPSGDPGAPVVSVAGNQSMIPGGGTGFEVTADAPFRQIFAWIDGHDGYYQVTFDDPRASAEVIVVYGHTLDASQYEFRFAVGNGVGAGSAQTHLMGVINVGTGDVQVSVSWDVPSDVDLYVVDPHGEEIYYGNPTSSSGGELDLDSNAGCHGADTRNENITWPSGQAPRGEYTVRVNYWAACGQARTNWVVTVQVDGQPPRTYTGTFSGQGTRGASGAGEVVTTFTY